MDTQHGTGAFDCEDANGSLLSLITRILPPKYSDTGLPLTGMNLEPHFVWGRGLKAGKLGDLTPRSTRLGPERTGILFYPAFSS